MSNVIYARFTDKNVATTDFLVQWDKGIILEVLGLTLPEPFEIHFSNDKKFLTSIPVIGENNRAQIPDILLETGENVYGFIFLHASEKDGETKYEINTPVCRKPKMSPFSE